MMTGDKRLNKYISVYSVLISGSIATGYFLDNVAPISRWSGLDFLLWMSFVLALFFLIRFILGAVIVRMNNRKGYGNEVVQDINYKKYGIISFVAILACYVLVWLAYYPGLWNYDPWQVDQVMNHAYDNNHPLVHTLLLGVCYLFGKKTGHLSIGVAIYDWIQMLFLAGVFSYVSVRILQETKRKWIYIASVIFYAVFPFNSIMAISTTKDVIFAGLVLLTVLLLLRYLKNNSKTVTIMLPIIMTLMLLFRKNAMIACLLFLIPAVIGVLKKVIPKKVLVLLPVVIGLYLGVNAVLTGALNPAPVVIREAASLPSVQMGRIYDEGFADEQDIEEIGRFVKLGEARYSPHLADTVKSRLHIYGKRDFIQMLICSAKLFLKHPIVSIEAFLYLHEGAWYLGDTSHSEVYGKEPEDRQGYLSTEIVESHYDSKYGITLHSKLSRLERLMEKLYSANEYQKNPILTVLFSPAFYNWILVGCMFVFLYCKQYKELFISFFFICLIITILFCACSIIRYYYPVFASIPLLVAWAVKAIEGNNQLKT